MVMSNVSAPQFKTSELAREWLEKVRWPEGPICSHCGAINHAYQTNKAGWYRCAKKKCRKDFTVTTGTVMERTHIPLNKWLMAFHMMASNGVSAHQLHLALDLSYKSAWFMCHRIREAMRGDGTALSSLLGVSAHRNPTNRLSRLKKSRVVSKHSVVALVQRGGDMGTFRGRTANKLTVSAIARDNIARESRLQHEADQNLVGSCARVDAFENLFSTFKRGMRCVYQHWSKKHLHRYLAEFDFRQNHRPSLGYSKIDRTVAAIKGVVGKRLIYRQPEVFNRVFDR